MVFDQSARFYVDGSRHLRHGERLLFLYRRANDTTAGSRCSTRACCGRGAEAAAWFGNAHDYPVNVGAVPAKGESSCEH